MRFRQLETLSMLIEREEKMTRVENTEELLGFTPSSKPMTNEKFQELLKQQRLTEQTFVQRIIDSKKERDVRDPLGR